MAEHAGALRWFARRQNELEAVLAEKDKVIARLEDDLQTAQERLRAAFAAGFDASSEGRNGEFPGVHDADLSEDFENWLKGNDG